MVQTEGSRAASRACTLLRSVTAVLPAIAPTALPRPKRSPRPAHTERRSGKSSGLPLHDECGDRSPKVGLRRDPAVGGPASGPARSADIYGGRGGPGPRWLTAAALPVA